VYFFGKLAHVSKFISAQKVKKKKRVVAQASLNRKQKSRILGEIQFLSTDLTK
jgi:hypothetical protein